jgi:hypothetical protein
MKLKVEVEEEQKRGGRCVSDRSCKRKSTGLNAQ